MAAIGLKHFVAAKLQTETDGSLPTYTQGTVIAKAMKVDLSWTRGNQKLYGDDVLVEQDNSISGGELTIGATYLPVASRLLMMADETFTVMTTTTSTTTTTTQIYATTGEPSPKVGCGFVTKESADGGDPIFYGWWYYKAQFGMDESYNTKGESIEYGTPEMKGTVMGIKPKADMKVRFREYGAFTTEAAAIAWVNSKAGIQ